MIRSLGIQSDQLVMTGLSTFETRCGMTIMRTPSEPDFWYGNRLIFDDRASTDQIDTFLDEFPDAAHVCIEWDRPNGDVGDLSGFSEKGFDVEDCDILTCSNPTPHPLPQGISIRPITPEDWPAVEALQLETALEAGYDPEPHKAFVARRFKNHRAQVAAGLAQWFCAFDRDELVGDLGIYANATIARYQAVETRQSHRRRGICAALVLEAAAWALKRAPKLVIVADRDEAPGRIYRRCGFELTERTVAVCKGSYHRAKPV